MRTGKPQIRKGKKQKKGEKTKPEQNNEVPKKLVSVKGLSNLF